MKKGKKGLASALLTGLLVMGISLSAYAEETSGISRGDFLKMVTTNLNISATSTVQLPKDVPSDSTYKDSVSTMLERKILKGFPDGSIRTNEPITGKDASIILGRVLGFKDAESINRLKSEMGIDWQSQQILSASEVEASLSKVLRNDENAVNLMAAVQKEMENIHSYESQVGMHMQMHIQSSSELNENNVNSALHDQSGTDKNTMSLKMDVEGKVQLDDKQGMMEKMTMKNFMGSGDLDSLTYMVPEGVYTQSPGMKTDKQWINMSKGMSTFDQLMKLQKANATQISSLNQKYFIFRDLGKDTIGGKPFAKVALYGKIPSLQGLLNGTQSLTGMGDMMSSLPSEGKETIKNMGVSANIVYWIDEAAHRIYKADMNMSYTMPAVGQAPEFMMDMATNMSYSKYNEPQTIILPAEAKKAPTMEEYMAQMSESLPQAGQK
ncbi:S-layer homology domain-containing protein [Paenibacillus sp.]|jgi:hypothetical protein|uniref:S-layer homology domain-containing protein n=1 Tax=Paenibacillus sp. TaxID=58172 RepID=UPI002821B782|nr:S-layer homology domain-containing protein [Paenibacillus sp.]MDR0270181.1 S-layer homology domain-containing protein [Paenibacillus sp.]